MRFVLTWFALTFLLTAVFATTAFAQPKASKGDKTEATRLKKEADTLMDQDRHADALAGYAKAYELTADPALLYNQGRALEAMGEYPEALDKLERFERDATPALRSKVPGLRDLIVDLRGRIATLIVTTNAPGARLLVREKAVGTIDKEKRVRVRSGAATIEVAAEGYLPFKKDVDLAAGNTLKVDAQLVLKKVDALLMVRSRPAADISVDGKPIGRAPIELHLPAGRHELLATARGHQSETVPMTLSLGDRRELDLELRQSPSIVTRWWFWTGIAVIAAAAATTVIAFNIERDPTPGTFGNGTVRGP